jgi:hypothetical protein
MRLFTRLPLETERFEQFRVLEAPGRAIRVAGWRGAGSWIVEPNGELRPEADPSLVGQPLETERRGAFGASRKGRVRWLLEVEFGQLVLQAQSAGQDATARAVLGIAEPDASHHLTPLAEDELLEVREAGARQKTWFVTLADGAITCRAIDALAGGVIHDAHPSGRECLAVLDRREIMRLEVSSGRVLVRTPAPAGDAFQAVRYLDDDHAVALTALGRLLVVALAQGSAAEELIPDGRKLSQRAFDPARPVEPPRCVGIERVYQYLATVRLERTSPADPFRGDVCVWHNDAPPLSSADPRQPVTRAFLSAAGG